MACEPLAQAPDTVRFIPLQSEYAVEIHRHGRVHRLEDSSGAAHHRVLLLADNVHGFDHGKSGGIVAVKKADLI